VIIFNSWERLVGKVGFHGLCLVQMHYSVTHILTNHNQVTEE